MVRERRSLFRRLLLAAALAGALLLLVGAREAGAAKYVVAQCGWYVDADAGWADTTGGAKFRPDAYCAKPPGTDPFDGAHMKSLTTAAATVSGTRFARWRWDAPPGTGITQMTATWWQVLHDGFEQRIGAVSTTGGFVPFAIAASTNVAPRNLVAGFGPGVHAIEDRLLCARAETKHCSLAPGSWSSLRAVTLTLEDNSPPAAGIGGQLFAGGWRRGVQNYGFWAGELGAGVRYGETTVDGVRVNLTEYPCAIAMIGGVWRGTRMRPCELGPASGANLSTATFGDGPHSVRHCVTDFAGNVGCTPIHVVAFDNHAPSAPRVLSLIDGDGWRRLNDFDVVWRNPDQAPGSPVVAARWRIVGTDGWDSGVRTTAGRQVASLPDRSVPRLGIHQLRVWLVDEAGNEAPATAATVNLRFDNVPPELAFAPPPGPDAAAELPASIEAIVSDEHSGLAGGEIAFRRLGTERWVELGTKLVAGEGEAPSRLVGRLPDGLPAGTYAFRAEAADVAGNRVTTTRRADGGEMALRKLPAAAQQSRSTTSAGAPSAAAGARTRVYARLRWRNLGGAGLTVPFGARAKLVGRLVTVGGAGLARRRLRVTSRSPRGALARRRVARVVTGPRGGFRLRLPAGVSRRVTVAFPGADGLAASRRPGIGLRVRGGVLLSAPRSALRNGEVLHLRGRVRTRGATLPRRGKLVAIQYFESAARRWRPVLLVRSDHNGRFRARYRFRYVAGAARIRMRAVAVAEERWPYVPGHSRPLTIRVSG